MSGGLAELAERHAATVERYRSRTPRSAAAYERSCRHLPGGNTRSNLHFAPYPPVIERAEGGVVVDVDGNRYDDLIGDYTVAVLGHSHPRIAEVVREQLGRGMSWGGRSSAEVELAAAVAARMPAIEQLRFVNSGTEANLMAVLTALDVTGRDTIVVFDGGYHGSALSYVPARPRTNVPVRALRLPYDDPDALRLAFAREGERIAAVCCELMLNSGGCIPAAPELVRAARELTEAHGALLIVDEVMTSRLGYGGLQARYGVRPDLVSLGKIIGGGFPIGAFGGRADVMAMYDLRRPGAAAHGGSFNNEIFSMACGVVALTELLTPAALDALNEGGDLLRSRLQAVADAADVPLVWTGIGSTAALHVGRDAPTRPTGGPLAEAVRAGFHLHATCDGVWIAARGMFATSLATTPDQADHLVACFASWVDETGPAIRAAHDAARHPAPAGGGAGRGR